MDTLTTGGTIEELREGLKRLDPPYLLRKYEAVPDDFEALADEDLRCEYLDGVLIVHSPASIAHEDRLVFLTTLLNTFVSARKLGRVFGSNAVMELGQPKFCPDLSFLAADHLDRIQRKRVVGPMDLVIEMISESTRDYDLGAKRMAYQAGKVGEIWLLDAERRLARADFLEQDGYATSSMSTGLIRSRVLPGFLLDVTWLWSDPLPNPVECLKTIDAMIKV